jgi:hypothetical protein
MRTPILPEGYSVRRSQYDPGNDVMYLFAVQDANGNGTGDAKEPVHVFWLSLKEPGKGRRMF